MQREGVVPDLITYNALISSCEKGKPLAVTYSSQPLHTARPGCGKALQRQGMVPDVITYKVLGDSSEGDNEGGGGLERLRGRERGQGASRPRSSRKH